MGYEMKLTGLTLLLVLLLVCVAWAGDCGKCHSQRDTSSCNSCEKQPACGECQHKHQCDSCAVQHDPCGKCKPEPCGSCKPRMREGCIPVPLPKAGCGSIDPDCCPRSEYTLCVERSEYRLLCPDKCAPKPKCSSCDKCKTDCPDGLDLASSLDQD